MGHSRPPVCNLGCADGESHTGGAGLSEWLFSEYYGDMVGTAGMALILAVFWRLITYYLYLLIGALVVPSWLSKDN